MDTNHIQGDKELEDMNPQVRGELYISKRLSRNKFTSCYSSVPNTTRLS